MNTNKQIVDIQPEDRFNFYGDPGHAWLEVPYNTLVKLKIHRQITEYSYHRDDMVYLEEDYDAVIFIKAYLQHIGKKEDDFKAFKPYCVNFESPHYSQIRNYQNYHNPALRRA
jgi:hypothetical protein